MTWANKIAFFLIGAIVIFTTIAYGTVHQPVLAVFYILVALAVVLWAVDGYRSRELRVSRSLLPFALLGAAVYGLIQVIPFGTFTDATGIDVPLTISLDPFATKVSALHFFALFLLLSVTLVLLDSASRIRKLAVVIAVFGFAYAFFAILQSVLSPLKIYGIYEAGAPFGSFVNRHNFAAYMEMAMALPLGLMFAGAVTKDKRLLYITVIGLMGVALLLSGSRGGLVAFVAQIIFLVMLTAGSRGKAQVGLRLALGALLLVAIVGGAIFVGGETSLTRFADTAAAEDVTTGRSNIWQVTLQVIMGNLPFGAGFGAFGVAYTVHDSMSGLERVEQAHNDYLQILADAGIVGLSIGAFFLWRLILQGREAVSISNRYRRGIAIGALAGIFSILVHSAFDFVLHTTAVSVLFLMLLSLLTASLRSYDDDVEDVPRERVRGRASGKVSSISSVRGRSRSR